MHPDEARLLTYAKYACGAGCAGLVIVICGIVAALVKGLFGMEGLG